MSTLYLVATPIGNLEDMTFRAARILKTVALIAAEDTRHTGKLLQHFGITTPQISYHDHNRQFRLPYLLEHLQQGRDLALVTDAGLPGICDPGADLVAACRQAEIPVIPLPGATAGLTALMASGLSTERFAFEGFLPPKVKPRQERLHSLLADPRTLIFYEAPHRLVATLTALAEVFGAERRVVTARELTKLHEEFWSGELGEACRHYQDQAPKGEFVILVEGARETAPTFSEGHLQVELQALLAQGLSRSDASRQLAQITQLPRRQLYQLALTLTVPDLSST